MTAPSHSTATNDVQAGRLSPAVIEAVKRSYGICCLHTDFFDDFYRSFVATSPEVGAKFTNTDMRKQKELLRASISFLMMYAGGSSIGIMKIEDLGKSHSRGRLDIRPEMYAFWLSSFLKTVKKHDPEANESAWTQVLKLGINAMASRY